MIGAVLAAGILVGTGAVAWFSRAAGWPWVPQLAIGAAVAGFAFLFPLAYVVATLALVMVACVGAEVAP